MALDNVLASVIQICPSTNARMNTKACKKTDLTFLLLLSIYANYNLTLLSLTHAYNLDSFILFSINELHYSFKNIYNIDFRKTMYGIEALYVPKL